MYTVHRVELYISNGWDKNIADPTAHKEQASNKTIQKRDSDSLQMPPDGWNAIEAGHIRLAFYHGHMIAYFVDRQACDKLPAGDVKSISEHAYALSERGHIQKIELTSDDNSIYLRANCLPEMRKDRTYKISLVLAKQSNHIIAAECGCPAGKAPTASCKHIAALCYALDKFCKYSELPEFLTCTDRLQSWNQPRPKKVRPVPVQELKFKKLEYGKKAVNYAKPLSSLFDPRPAKYRLSDSSAVTEMYEKLVRLGKPCGFLHVLGPAVDRADSVHHDHSYAQAADPPGSLAPRHTFIMSSEPESVPQLPTKEDMARFKEELVLACDEINELERNTRAQYAQPEWKEKRKYRITGSVCGKVLQRNSRAVAREILYPKPFQYLPAPMAWGRRYEQTARKLYSEKRSLDLARVVTTQDCGLFVHRCYGWLAATPDATVHIDGSPVPAGILEVKCPYTERFNDIRESCTKGSFFCCSDLYGNIVLKRDHAYYHQVQLQLEATSAKWCDFCVYTTRGIVIERIYPDKAWKVTNIPKLEYFYDNILLPEILFPRMKPSYVL